MKRLVVGFLLFSVQSTTEITVRFTEFIKLGCSVRWFIFSVLLIDLLLLSNRAIPQDSVDPQSPEELIRFCIHGVKESSKSLTSGCATFEGRLTAKYRNAPENDQDGSVGGVFAFENGKIRFDITRPGWAVDKSREKEFRVEPNDKQNPKAGESLVAKMKKGQITKRFCDNGSQVAVWNSDQPMVSIARPADLVDRRATEYIDYRCPTLFDPFSISRGWTLEHILNRFETEFDNSNASVTRQGAIWTVSWKSVNDNEATRWVLDIDTNSGFVPVRYRCESSLVDDENNPTKWIPEWENKTTWKQESGVLIPIHIERLRFEGPYSGVSEELVLKFNWESVNEPVDENVFTYATFDVPDDIAIQDTSSGETVWIRDFPGDENIPIQPTNRRLLITSNLIIITMIVLAWGVRSLWRRASPSV